jgi:hypothetical protein
LNFERARRVPKACMLRRRMRHAARGRQRGGGEGWAGAVEVGERGGERESVGGNEDEEGPP